MFEKIVKFLVEFQAGLKGVWQALPKEVRVALYVLSSITLAEIIKELQLLSVNSRLLSVIINILLVFFAEMPTRIQSLRAKNGNK